MSLKVAIVGCGKIADAHVEEIRKLDGRAEVVAVCDRERLLAEYFAMRYSVPAYYENVGDLLRAERPDIVHVTTPPQSHLPVATEALAAGCHVYVEKPFALNVEEARQLTEFATRQERRVTVGYLSYFDPPALEMRKLVAEGAVGDVIHVESFYGCDLSDAFGRALLADPFHWVHQLPGRLFQNLIDHLLSRVTEFISDEEPHVLAGASTLRRERFGDRRDDFPDELRVMIQGAQTSAYATFSSHIRPAAQYVRICGSKNTLVVDYNNRILTFQSSSKLPGPVGRLWSPFEQAKELILQGSKNALRFAKADFQYFAGLKHLLSRFYDSIEQGTEVPIPYRDILRVSRLMDVIFEQTARGVAA